MVEGRAAAPGRVVPDETVAPMRGAAIRFRFVPPEDSRFDAQELVGREVTLTWHPANQGFWTGHPRRTLVIDEHFEVLADGLRPENANELEASLPPAGSFWWGARGCQRAAAR